jgi:four helix bundle protein
MTPQELKARTKQFSLAIIRLIQQLPRSAEAQLVGQQLLRSATSVAANYRGTCLARSPREFIAKLGLVLEEADESAFWLEILEEAQLLGIGQGTELRKEASELCAIFAASLRTARLKSSRTP